MLKLKKHIGPILTPTKNTIDEGGSTFAYIYKENSTHYLFYTASPNPQWERATIALATSEDGVTFTKRPNPIFSHGAETVTPNIIKLHEAYWMIFAYAEKKGCRRIGIASAQSLEGPWTFEKELIHPEPTWEGTGIDLGPSLTQINEKSFYLYYSNVRNKPLDRLLLTGYWRRQIGLLKVTIKDDKTIISERDEGNPLSHLNGKKGNWNESLFCPGHFTWRDKHYLLPAASTYSQPPPYKQSIGLIESENNSFTKNTQYTKLIDGPKEKAHIIPNIKDEIALDSPSTLIKNDELWVYYATMDRSDSIWKIALSIYQLPDN